MAIKRTILVLSFDDEKNSFDNAHDLATVVAGCIEDMDSESFPDLSISSYDSVDDLAADFSQKDGAFRTEAEMVPVATDKAMKL